MKKKVLVTGGAGYIGSTVVRNLLINNYEVFTVDNLMQGPLGVNCFLGHNSYHFIKDDIINKSTIKDLTKKVDYVVHLAAIVGEAACKKDKDLTINTNIEATKNLVNFSLENKVKRFIFLSTCSSYGVQSTDQMANEETPLNPVSLYAESKISMEDYIKKQCNTDMSYTILRPSTVHGASPRMRFDLIVNHFVKDALTKKELQIFGPNLWRPLMWVGEAGRAIDTILRSNENLIKNQIFNLGNTKDNLQKSEVGKIIKEKFIKDPKISYLGQDQDLRSYRVDFTKIEKQLNFKLEKSLEEAISEIIFSINNNLYKDLDSPIYKNH